MSISLYEDTSKIIYCISIPVEKKCRHCGKPIQDFEYISYQDLIEWCQTIKIEGWFE